MGKDSAARIEFHQMGTVNEKVRESDFVPWKWCRLLAERKPLEGI